MQCNVRIPTVSSMLLQAANELHLLVALASQIHLLETETSGAIHSKQCGAAIFIAVVDSFLKASTLRSSSLASRS